jgi:Zn-dependent protease
VTERAGGFRLLGVPVRVDPSIIFVLLILASTAHTTMAALLAFLVGGAIALVAHELGHAVVARALGATDVTITLHSFGGLTSYRLPVVTRPRMSAIAAAGPAVGLGLGVLVWLAEQAAAPADFSEGARIYEQLLFVTVGWSVINLLPVVPLDGGRLLEQILPGSAETRARLAGLISTVVGGALAVWFWRAGYAFGALMFALLAGYALMSTLRGNDPVSEPPDRPSYEAFAKVVAGDYAGAAGVVESAAPAEPALTMLLRAVLANDAAAAEGLRQRYAELPGDPMVRSCLVIWQAHQRDWQGALAMLHAGNLLPGTGHAALRMAYQAGAFTAGAGIGEAVLRELHDPWVAYNTACCWARTGNEELALSALRRAVDYGWTDWGALDRDSDLSAVRDTSSYRSWRMTLPGGTGPETTTEPV